MDGAFIGWDTWTRTKIYGVRVRCSTIKLYPKTFLILSDSFFIASTFYKFLSFFLPKKETCNPLFLILQ